MKIVGYQIFLRITRFVILVIRPDYREFCLRSTPVLKYNQEYISITEQFFVPWESNKVFDIKVT